MTVPGIPPSPNQTRREHWAKRAAAAKQWKRDAFYAAVEAREVWRGRVRFPLPSAAVRLVIVSPTSVRRDPDNAIASMKPLIDGLVQAGIIADDSFAVVRELTVGLERGKQAAVRIEVTP